MTCEFLSSCVSEDSAVVSKVHESFIKMMYKSREKRTGRSVEHKLYCRSAWIKL